MEKFITFLSIFLILSTSIYAFELDAVFSQGDSKTVKFENLDLEIKLVQVTNDNAVFSLNNRLINEIKLGDKKDLSEQISIKVTNIYKEEGNTFVKAKFEFDSQNLDLSFLEKSIQHGGTSIGSKAGADVNETSKNRFNLVIGQEKFVVDLDTTVKLLNISNSTAILSMSNGIGKVNLNLNENSPAEDLGVRLTVITISERKATFVMLKSTQAVIEEKTDIPKVEDKNQSFTGKIMKWLVSLFKW